MRHNAETPPVASVPRKPSMSHTLSDVRLYRPGPLLATSVLLLPPLLALLGAGIALSRLGHIPLWLPLILLLWIPLLAAAWVLMTSVRTSPAGIAIARPWGRWNEISWTVIDHISRRGPRILIHASDGRSLRFYPLTLHDGGRLERELLMRLPVHVLDARLRGDARELLGEPIGQRAQSLVASPLATRPRRLWSGSLIVIIVITALGAAYGGLVLPFPLALLPICLALAVTGCCALALPTCLQTVTLDDSGVTTRGLFSRSARHLAWDDIQLVERTARERVLRLRGERRLRCPGPGLLTATDAEIFRAYLQTYCTERDALTIVRRWL